MSEYQYYEFVAIDGPISDEGMRYARDCSTGSDRDVMCIASCGS